MDMRTQAPMLFSLQQILRLLELNLFERRSLIELLDLRHRPPTDPPPRQLEFVWR